MISISFKSRTPDPIGEIIKDIKILESNLKSKGDALAIETANQMKTIINENKVRPQTEEPTELENAINAEMFDNGWGVGDVEKLRKEAPGWAAINFGSSHMVGKHLPLGTFNPGEPAPAQSYFRAGRWKKGEEYNGKTYSPLVTKPIPAMNYIEKTIFWLNSKFDALKGQKDGAL